MPPSRKRRRGEEDEASDIPPPMNTKNTMSSIIAPPEVVPALLLKKAPACPRRRPAAPPSFTLAPSGALPVWQRAVLSGLRRVQAGGVAARRGAARGRGLTRDLARHHEEQQRREEKLHWQQHESRVRLGNKLFTAIEKQWGRRGDVFQQLLCVEFDEVKRRHTERRQEDLLREAENITRTLLESIFAEGKSQSAVVQNNNNSNSNSGAGDISVSDDVAAAATTILQEGNDDSIVAGELENSLSLLDTQGGKRPLRDYQRSALRWMTNLYSKNLNGILADEMGLGKTIQTIALLCYFAEYKNDWGPHLIVVPTTVVLNWKAEFQRWCPGMKVKVYLGTRKERHRLRQGWMSEDAFHVCITSYNTVVMDKAVFRRRPWGFLVLDEAHQVKNFMSKKWQTLFELRTEYRLLLTGTPLQSSIMELWSLFHFLLPFASAFNSNEEFREWFSNPMEDMVTGRTSLNEDVVRRLQALLRPFMLRRLKKDVESQLPSKTEKVVMCRLSQRQRLLYDDYMQLTETRERIRGGAGGVLGVLLSLRKVCNHPDMFEERRTISPMGLDYLSEIILYVPRNILLLNNNYNGCYRFQKWRLCIEDISLPLNYNNKKKENNELFNDSWLKCNLTKLLFINHPYNQQEQLNRYSPENFIWPSSEVSTKSILGGTQGSELSDTVWQILSHHIEQKQIIISKRRQITTSIQAKRYRSMEVAINLWYPPCLNIMKSRFITKESLLLLLLLKSSKLLFPTVKQRAMAIFPIVRKFAVYVPKVAAAHPPRLHCRLPISHYKPFRAHSRESLAPLFALAIPKKNKDNNSKTTVFDGSFFLSEFWPLQVRRCFSFPDKRLLIHDCGKLQFLEHALKQLRREGHRMLIFTQFVLMLNILERFLAIIGLPYLRIDGSTQPEKRQAFVDRFNEDERITCMILSTRSGGIGLNLTGADTVIFYDSDWNPTMDLQAQDRCHRIGQTKPVTIYRLISEHTVEESILQKARERKKLNNVVIRGGQFHAMASVEDMYEDSSAALAALSDPIKLRSFFHDLDEDATVVEDNQQELYNAVNESNNTNNNNNINNKVAEVDIRAEMMMVEDQEDREAQQNVEEEIRELEEQKRNDEAELDDDDDEEEEEEDDEENEDEDEEKGEERKRKRRERLRNSKLKQGIKEEEGDNEEEDLIGLSLNNNNNNSSNNNAIVSSSSYPSSLAVIQKRREILRKLRTPIDKLFSLQFGVCHAKAARERYDRLCENYINQVGEDELPAFTTAFRL